jgi:hypothetical protein
MADSNLALEEYARNKSGKHPDHHNQEYYSRGGEVDQGHCIREI